MSTTQNRSAEEVTLKGDELRTFPQSSEVRAAHDEDTETEGGRSLITELEGVAVPYNTWTTTGYCWEQFAPGAFKKTLSDHGSRLPLLLWHRYDTWPVGAAEEWSEAKEGLVGRWEMDDSEDAQRAAGLAEKRMLTGLSIGFNLSGREEDNIWVDRETGEPLGFEERFTNPKAGVIRKAVGRLLEVSLTATPAYAGAQVSLTRSLEGRRLFDVRHQPNHREGLAEWRRYLASVRR